MNPQEKAIDLIQKFEGLVARPFDGKGGIRISDSVRQKVLICCDEVMSEIEPDVLFQNYNERVSYWKDVKEHVQSL